MRGPRPPLRLSPASEYSADAMAALFNRCYAGYYVSIQLDGPGFSNMLAWFDVSPEDSRVGSEGELAVACAMLAVRDRRGWIAGMGVAPEARGSGLGHAMMEAVIGRAIARGLASVDLEVLEQNEPAIRIYEALGFRDRRLVAFWGRDPAPPPPPPRRAALVVTPASVEDCLACHGALHAARPAWQCDAPSIEHAAGRLRALAVRDRGAIRAWIVYRAEAGAVRIADIAAADEPMGEPGGASAACEALLLELIAAHPAASITLLNLPAAHAAEPALTRLGFGVRLSQREMTLALAAPRGADGRAATPPA